MWVVSLAHRLSTSDRLSCTQQQLRPWLDAFPREQLLILFMDDMRTPEATHAQVGKVGTYVGY